MSKATSTTDEDAVEVLRPAFPASDSRAKLKRDRRTELASAPLGYVSGSRFLRLFSGSLFCLSIAKRD